MEENRKEKKSEFIEGERKILARQNKQRRESVDQ
jgi:hypothetical protein